MRGLLAELVMETSTQAPDRRVENQILLEGGRKLTIHNIQSKVIGMAFSIGLILSILRKWMNNLLEKLETNSYKKKRKKGTF